MKRKVLKTTTKNWMSVQPYAEGYAGKGKYEGYLGTKVSKGPFSLDVGTGIGTAFKPETDVTLSINIPITKKVKSKKNKI
jgi:hypothetical protein